MKKFAKGEVLDLVKKSSTALSHHALFEILGSSYNRVTLYRALDKLIEEKEIHRIVDIDGVSKFIYCKNCTEEHHHNHIHFSCVKCSHVSCLDTIKPKFELPKTFTILEVNFVVKGYCSKCT